MIDLQDIRSLALAAEQTRKRPGGVANQALDAAIKALPEVERKEGVA